MHPCAVVDFDGIAPAPQFALYPLADQIADKVAATYYRYGPRRAPSTRFHDVVDLRFVVRHCQSQKIPGVGTVTACSILARTGNPSRFPNEAAYVNYAGTAPVEIASADKQRHRISRSGDRALYAAIHIVAVTQSRTPSSPGYEYHRRKMDEGKTSREAVRCLKRQVAERLWLTMRCDAEQRLQTAIA